jgi:hypothetical protein
MAISHVFAQGVGPFKSVHLDLRGPDGKPSLGPHILAGVNGSGKSTLLKAIAWCLSSGGGAYGFPAEEWAHYLHHNSEPRVLLVWDFEGLNRFAWAITSDRANGWETRLDAWAASRLEAVDVDPAEFPSQMRTSGRFNAAQFGRRQRLSQGVGFNVATYSSVPSVRHLDRPDIALPRTVKGMLGFDSTVQNEDIQSWLLGLYSRRAIAKERDELSSGYTASLEALERGLTRICEKEVSIYVDIERAFQLKLQVGSQTLNFSQIPDGVRVTFGWLADFLMRQESCDWQPEFEDLKPGLLLFDEIEGFLHPLWQRRVLPALRQALPATQTIVASHSPFVISSCPGSTIHVLNVNSDGTAYVDRRVPAPIGESITSTLKDIFGVESRFDVETEEELAEWNELKKIKVQRPLSSAEESRFRELHDVLAARSEELRSLVTPTTEWSQDTLDELAETVTGQRAKKRSLVTR